jgi:hypothetical protein
MARYWSFSTAVFLGIWLMLMLGGRSALFQDPGTFWHTRLGLQTLEGGSLTRLDTFSFTASGQQWADAQWMPEWVMALVYRACGWDGLLLLTAAILAAIYALLAGRLAGQGLNAAAVLALLALALGASSHQFHVRPLIVTIGLLAWLFCRLSDVEAGRRSLRTLFWLLPVLVLWTNCHGGVLAGLGTLGLVVAGWCIRPVSTSGSPLRGGRARLLAMGLVGACLATVMLNPYGLDLPRGWLHVLTLPLPEMIQEHAPLDLRQPYAWFVLLLGGIYVGVGLSTPRRQWRTTWLLPLVWLGLAFLRVRNSPLFAVTALISLGEMLPQSRWAAVLTRRGWLRATDLKTRPKPHFRAALVPLAIVLAVSGLQAGGVQVPLVGRGGVQLDPRHWPVDLLPELRRIEASRGDPTPVFNDILYGGFLIFHTPRLRVFIDDRCELYGAAMLREYRQAEVERPAQLDPWAAQWSFHYALVENDSPMDQYLAGQMAWRLIRRGAGASLYEKSRFSNSSSLTSAESDLAFILEGSAKACL